MNSWKHNKETNTHICYCKVQYKSIQKQNINYFLFIYSAALGRKSINNIQFLDNFWIFLLRYSHWQWSEARIISSIRTAGEEEHVGVGTGIWKGVDVASYKVHIMQKGVLGNLRLGKQSDLFPKFCVLVNRVTYFQNSGTYWTLCKFY